MIIAVFAFGIVFALVFTYTMHRLGFMSGPEWCVTQITWEEVDNGI